MVHPVDAHVGRRVRELRLLRGMTQAVLAEQLGLSFQQLQKYETGHNRVSASRMFEIAQLLSVDPSYFFEGLQGGDSNVAPLLDERTARAAQALSSIGDEAVRNQINSMIMEVAKRDASHERRSA